ncbi:chemotaxis protein CheB [uncultured Pontibacter sp.]|uniref:chemotaxis protein CheB n=1 Tax=uncultured Pontibacter sp. TaxID=453356 RepID=UPI0026290DB2|nr:chemotaxis protein CheB [uncultured Pontibacter sp.]
MRKTPDLIVIGGSWGGIKASLEILQGLPEDYKIPIVLVLHRLRDQEGNLKQLFDKRLNLKVEEVEDKEAVCSGYVYIAPANYHVLLENDKSFSLDVSDLVNYSRPSIDVTFISAADTYGEGVIGILLSGASKDGSMGLKRIADAGGIALVQDPAEAEVAVMPLAAIEAVPTCSVQGLNSLKDYLLSLT